MSKYDSLEHHQPRKIDKKKHRRRGFSEDVQDKRQQRVGFKNYLRQIEEEELLIDDYNDDDPLNDITHREREVLYWVSHGLNNKEISERMYLSEKTIKNHVSNILRKLDLDDRTKAAAFAWEEGLPLLPEDFFTQLKMN